MNRQDLNSQIQSESIKENFLNFMKLNMINVYNICSKRCISGFNSKDLSDKEKICLSKCFDRKTETFQMSMDYLNKYSEEVAKVKKGDRSTAFVDDIKFG